MNEVDVISEQVPHDPTTISFVDDTTDLIPMYLPRIAEPIVIRGAGHITVFALNNKFDEEYPAALTHKVSRDEFHETIRRVNTILRKNVPNNFKWLVPLPLSTGSMRIKLILLGSFADAFVAAVPSVFHSVLFSI